MATKAVGTKSNFGGGGGGGSIKEDQGVWGRVNEV